MKKYILKDISIEITNQCNLRCKLCNIWKEKNKILTLENIKHLLFPLVNTYNLSSVSITGGEPFLHPQFEPILRFLTLLRIKKKIKSIGIYSNGYAVEKIKSIFNRNRKYIYDISVGISLDGLGKQHNFLRGRNNALKNTLKTIGYINSNFRGSVKLEIKFTINEFNYCLIYKVYKYCKENNIYYSPKFAEYAVKNYYHRNSLPLKSNIFEEKEIRESIRKQLINIIKDEQKTNYSHINLKIVKMLIGFNELQTDFIKSCLTPSHYLFITSEGNVYPCLYSESIGDINDISTAVLNTKHQEIIQRGLAGNCPKCYAYHGFLKEINFPAK